MKKINMNSKNGQRPIDNLTSESYSWLKKSWIVVKKNDLRWWQTAFVLAFFAGLIIAVIVVVRFQIQTSSVASGEQATLAISSTSSSVTVGDPFTANIMLDTKGSNVVAVMAAVSYDKNSLQLASFDTASSIFSANNTCVYNSKPCQIINDDPANGKIIITLAKPKPGVNTAAGKIAELNFKTISTSSASSVKIDFVSIGNYADSNVILDDGKGTDILALTTNATVAIAPLPVPVCTEFSYSSWGECQLDSTQTRTVTTVLPAGCTGGTPILKQQCVYPVKEIVAPVCSSFIYSPWSKCVSGVRTRVVRSSSPSGCVDGNPSLTSTCSSRKR